MIITIDGPVASGKSSVAHVVAQKLNIYYLHTGLLYRAFAYCLDQENIQELDGFLAALTSDVATAIASRITYQYRNGKPVITVDGTQLDAQLHTATTGQLASRVSANQHVRTALLSLQRDVAQRYDIIADGRDCGSVVFPQADHKFYLTASQKVRAERFITDPDRKLTDLNKALANIQQRDKRDMTREVAPLIIPHDATVIDSSDLTFDQTVDAIMSIVTKSWQKF